jgi:hypothetical protein
VDVTVIKSGVGEVSAIDIERARCAFFDRIYQSRMPLVLTPARFKQAGV